MTIDLTTKTLGTICGALYVLPTLPFISFRETANHTFGKRSKAARFIVRLCIAFSTTALAALHLSVICWRQLFPKEASTKPVDHGDGQTSVVG